MARRSRGRWDDEDYERPRWPGVAIFFGILLLLAAAGAFLTLSGYGPFAFETTTDEPTQTETPSEGVVPLMTQAGCEGELVETQPPSTETGQCTLADGTEITIGLFATTQDADQWIQAAKADAQFAGAIVKGDGWAAKVTPATGASAVATSLGGEVVP